MRLVDHRALASVAVVFGSLRFGEGMGGGTGVAGGGGGGGGSSAPFDEHIVVVGWSDGQGGHGSSTLYLDGAEVELAGGASLDGAPGLGSGPVAPRMSWRSSKHGGLRVSGDEARLQAATPRKKKLQPGVIQATTLLPAIPSQARLSLQLPGLELDANISAPRVAWDAAQPDCRGPEGWLARTHLLPCHYFVHSFGSPATYRLAPPASQRAQRDRRGGGGGGGGGVAVGSGAVPALSGHALAHMERNYGVSFPEGWVWGQAIGRGGAVHLVLTGGRFVIGPTSSEQVLTMLLTMLLSKNLTLTLALPLPLTLTVHPK